MSFERDITTAQLGKGCTTSTSRTWLKCRVRVAMFPLGLYFCVRKGAMIIYCSARAVAITYNKFRGFVILEQQKSVNFHLCVSSWTLRLILCKQSRNLKLPSVNGWTSLTSMLQWGYSPRDIVELQSNKTQGKTYKLSYKKQRLFKSLCYTV